MTLEIPFSVPPYMSLLARSVATLEGIALAGDPNYAMVAQAYPFVVRKVLRNDSTSSASILREILFDSNGVIKTTRVSTLLNAALGYVADTQVRLNSIRNEYLHVSVQTISLVWLQSGQRPVERCNLFNLTTMLISRDKSESLERKFILLSRVIKIETLFTD